MVDHTNVNDVEGEPAENTEPAGVVTTAIAAVTPPPVGTVVDDLTATIPSPAEVTAKPSATAL